MTSPSPAPLPWMPPYTLRIVPFTPKYAAFAENADAILELARQAAVDGIDALVFPEASLRGGAIDDREGGPDPDPFFLQPAVVAAMQEQCQRLTAPAPANFPAILGLSGHDALADIPILSAGALPYAFPGTDHEMAALGTDGQLPPTFLSVSPLCLEGRDAAVIYPGGVLLCDAAHGLVRTPLFDPRPVDVQLDRDADGRPVFDVLNHTTTPIPADDLPDSLHDLWSALTFALRQYVELCHFPGALVALSGGIDSALVATLAVDALGTGRVWGVTMPSTVTSSETLSDAHDLARRLHIPCLTLPIADPVASLQTALEQAIGAGGGAWPGASPLPPPLQNSLMSENLQARVRGTLVMSLSNLYGHLVLATSNRSESLTGYSTLYGDMCGGYAPICDLAKTDVFALSRWRNAQPAAACGPAGPEPIPPSTIERPPTAELRPGQKDSDSLPPYDLLDPLLDAYVDRRMPLASLPCDRPTALRLQSLVTRSEYKRRQAAPGPRLRHPSPPLPLLSAFRE
ncbi:MAG: NAD(+) synthase [Kiritimatiellae bacterium]|nr:NAD(+) synthase [Kiritimatiellia bacterium]